MSLPNIIVVVPDVFVLSKIRSPVVEVNVVFVPSWTRVRSLPSPKTRLTLSARVKLVEVQSFPAAPMLMREP